MSKMQNLCRHCSPAGSRTVVTSLSSPHNNDYELPVDYVVTNYQGTSKYSLNHINSIFFKDGKIYNLLEKTNPKRIIKCRCVKSYCEAKYCECFRANETCGDDCTCLGCRNRRTRKSAVKKEPELSCNCVKSGCLKKYCQCFQNGRKCSERCRCCYCKNCEEVGRN